MPEQHRHLANKYEDTVNLQGAEAYRGGRPPAACYKHFTFNKKDTSVVLTLLVCISRGIYEVLRKRKAYGTHAMVCKLVKL